MALPLSKSKKVSLFETFLSDFQPLCIYLLFCIVAKLNWVPKIDWAKVSQLTGIGTFSFTRWRPLMCTLTFGCLEEPRWAFTHAAMHFPLIPTMISWRLSREQQPQTTKEMQEVFRYENTFFLLRIRNFWPFLCREDHADQTCKPLIFTK